MIFWSRYRGNMMQIFSFRFHTLIINNLKEHCLSQDLLKSVVFINQQKDDAQKEEKSNTFALV
jgi:hypothetical protein